MRIPRYYCPNCRRFKNRLQVRESEYCIAYWCNACSEKIVEVDEWLLEQAIKHFDIRKVPSGCESCKYREAADEKQQSDQAV